MVHGLAFTPNGDTADADRDRQIQDLVPSEYKRLPCVVRCKKNIIVMNGVVHVWATVTSDKEVEALGVAVEAIPGTKGFKDTWAGGMDSSMCTEGSRSFRVIQTMAHRPSVPIVTDRREELGR